MVAYSRKTHKITFLDYPNIVCGTLPMSVLLPYLHTTCSFMPAQYTDYIFTSKHKCLSVVFGHEQAHIFMKLSLSFLLSCPAVDLPS